MLRRLSVHGAGQEEPKENYVWENLSAPTFTAGAATSFASRRITPAMREYAIAGTLHLDHLAGLRNSPANANTVDLSAYQLSEALDLSEAESRQKLERLLKQHSREWKSFMDSLGKNSFINDWVSGVQS
jgi:hypothetical protein